jgi:hypothetical protein
MIQSCNAKIRYTSTCLSSIIRPIFACAFIYLTIRLLSLRWSVVIFDVILEVLCAIVCVNPRYATRPVHGEASRFREWRVCTIFAQCHHSMQQLTDFQFVEIISDKADSMSLSEHLPFQNESDLDKRNKRGESNSHVAGFAHAKVTETCVKLPLSRLRVMPP